MAVFKKQILVQVSSPAGNFLKNWTNFIFQGFTKELNAGIGELILTLGEKFDYDNPDLALGNDIEIRVSDKDTVNSTLGQKDTAASRIIYKGYISMVERDISGNRENITVHALGYYTKLGQDVLKNGSQTTLYSESSAGLTVTAGSQSAADIGKIIRAVLDRYIAENSGAKIGYDSADIPDTSTTATYRFEQKTYREALDILRKLAPVGTYWYADETGNIKFKPTPTTPTHQFIFGKHFNEVKVQQSVEKLRNFLLLWNGETGGAKVYAHYQDNESIATHGRMAERSNDYGVDNADGAALIGAKFLAENKQSETKVRAVILDNNGGDFGYDIESIQPGDTCQFQGFNVGVSEIFRDNMIITKVNYYLDRVEIEVEVVKSGLLDFQEKQGKDIGDLGSGALQIPESYT